MGLPQCWRQFVSFNNNTCRNGDHFDICARNFRKWFWDDDNSRSRYHRPSDFHSNVGIKLSGGCFEMPAGACLMAVTNSSIEDLSDVAAMTEKLGDLLYWDGSNWTDLATSSLDLYATGLGAADFGEFTCDGNTCTLDAESQALAEASDVTITAAAYGDFIMYNGAAWVDTATSTLFSTSAQLSGWLSDKSGTGAFVLGTSPTITTPTITGHATLASASTTVLSANWLKVGQSASTTIDTAGNVATAGTLNVTGLTTLANASTTLFSTGYASSTLYYGAGLANCASENMLTWTDGRFGCEFDTLAAAHHSASHGSSSMAAHISPPRQRSRSSLRLYSVLELLLRGDVSPSATITSPRQRHHSSSHRLLQELPPRRSSSW